jgi:hypothetical protein
MTIKFLVQEKNEQSVVEEKVLPEPLLDFRECVSKVAVLHEGVTKSTDPSVMLISLDPSGTVIIQITYSELIDLATKVMDSAEANWGWPRPDIFNDESKIKQEILALVADALS